MPLMCCLYRLREGTDKEAWDRFVRDSDIPLTLGLPSVRSYRVLRAGPQLEGSADYDYLELMDYSDDEALKRDMASDEWKQGMDAMYQHGLESEVCFLVSDVAGQEP